MGKGLPLFKRDGLAQRGVIVHWNLNGILICHCNSIFQVIMICGRMIRKIMMGIIDFVVFVLKISCIEYSIFYFRNTFILNDGAFHQGRKSLRPIFYIHPCRHSRQAWRFRLISGDRRFRNVCKMAVSSHVDHLIEDG